jgi:hypothetical protein
METPAGWHDHLRWARARDLTGLIVAWTVWLAMTAYLILYLRNFSRDIPFMDDFDMVPVLTGAAEPTLAWAWSQHHEHRPMISRFILVGLARFVDRDFRTARYVNVGLLSAMAASMLILARRLRGSARVTDAVLPLAFLSIAQAESLMIGFAMNLILTSFIAVALILAAGVSRRGDGRAMAVVTGLSLVLLPLSGGSGVTMVPPLAAWLAGYVAWGWWSGRKPSGAIRALGAALLLASSGIVALYLRGYSQPAHHRLSSSPSTVAVGAIKYLSLSVYPSLPYFDRYWWPASWILLAILIATLVLLARVAIRTPAERPRSLGLMAVIVSMLTVAGALGVSRGGFVENGTLLSRYVTLAIPLLGALYIAWLAYGQAPARVGIHVVLLALVASTLPGNDRFSRAYGRPIRAAAQRVEEGLKSHAPTASVLNAACPSLYPLRDYVYDRFKLLKAARVGPFTEFEEDRVATTTSAAIAVRR